MSSLQTCIRTAVAVLFLALALSAVAPAQVVGGAISGTVFDQSNASIGQASVVIRNEETGSQRRLTTNSDGTFSAPSIPIGTYTVSVEHDGFASEKRTGIAVTIGQAVQLRFVLYLGKVEQVVTVADVPQGVDTTTQQTQGLVNERQVKELPLNGRSFDQLLMLNPASINYTTQRSGGVGTSNSSVGNIFSVSGRRPQDNLFLLNGIEYTGASLINVTPGGTSGQLLGVEAVREFNVVSDTYGANYGKRTGAQISIVTASGTDSLHGSVYEFFRNSALDARNYFDQAQIPPFQRNDFGAALGGPLRHDKVFLFGNYEGYRQHLGLSDVTSFPTRPRAPQLSRACSRCWRFGRRVLSIWGRESPKHSRTRRSTSVRTSARRVPMPIFRRMIFSSAFTPSTTAMRPRHPPIPIHRSTNNCASRLPACRSSMSFRRAC